jgi:glutathione S-transferase
MSIYSSKLTSGGRAPLRCGFVWRRRIWDSRNADHLKPEHLKLNPNWVVSTIVHDEMAISNSSVIMEYIDV